MIQKENFADILRNEIEFVIISPALSKYPKTPQSRRNLSSSIRVTYDSMEDKFIVESSHEGFRFLDRGVRPHVMFYLLDKTVPIRTKDGRLIFRKVSFDSILKGGWKHSGIPSQNYISKAVDRVFKNNKSAVRKQIMEQVFKNAGYHKT